MLLTRNSGRKDTTFLLIDKYFLSFSYEYLLGYRNRIASRAQIPIVNG